MTIDHVNPEAPWPHLTELETRTRAADKELAPRLPVHPRYVHATAEWIDPALHRAVRVQVDAAVNTAQWLEVMRTAHRVGLRSTATIMYGHVERPEHWANHLMRIRDLQRETGGFTEFVPLPFVHMEAPIYLKGGARKGPTWREAVLMHTVGRLALHPWIPNIQTSWVKMGSEGVTACLNAGVNDLGGTLMDESITRAAGAAHGQEMPPAAMDALSAAVGCPVRQRTTLYGHPPAEQVVRSDRAAAVGWRATREAAILLQRRTADATNPPGKGGVTRYETQESANHRHLDNTNALQHWR